MMRRFQAYVALLAVVAACGGSKFNASPNDVDGSAPMGDAGSAVEASAEASPEASLPVPDGGFVPGNPISAPPGQWTWVPFANAFCGDGSATGIGINPSSTGTRVLVYLEGGGACWDASTCYTLMTAAYFTTGYTQADFTAESSDATYLALPGGFFDRTVSTNPFKDYSYVYIPYCTGDIFAGNNVTTLGKSTAHFVGYTNMTAFLERVVPTFPTAARVVLAGSSAGGFGALYNWWQVQADFGSIRVDLLDDSGTFMPPDVLAEGNGDQTIEATAWNLAATAPPCATCGMNPAAFYGYYAQAFPTHRGALLSYLDDSVLPTYFGITTAQFTMGLDEDITQEFKPNPNLQAFVYNGTGHVLFFDPLVTQNGTTLQTFLTQMETDSTSWATIQP